jgi:hypothetical protein
MAIQTQIQPRQTRYNVIYAVLCFALGAWGWYDYAIAIPAEQAAFEEYTAAEKTKSELENLAKATTLSDAEKEQFRLASAVLQRYKDEKPAEPASYDRAIQLWGFVVGCGVLGVPPFLYMQWKLWRSRRRLDDDGTLHGPEGSFTQAQIVGIDLSKWMDKGLAHLEVEGGRRIPLDQWKFKFTEDIVGVYAQRFEPGKWTSDAYPIGDKRSRETKQAEPETDATGDGGDAGAAGTASANQPTSSGAKAALHADGEAAGDAGSDD